MQNYHVQLDESRHSAYFSPWKELWVLPELPTKVHKPVQKCEHKQSVHKPVHILYMQIHIQNCFNFWLWPGYLLDGPFYSNRTPSKLWIKNIEKNVKYRFINQVLFYNQDILETILFYYWSWISLFTIWFNYWFRKLAFQFMIFFTIQASGTCDMIRIFMQSF